MVCVGISGYYMCTGTLLKRGVRGRLCFPGAYVGAGVGVCSAASHALHAHSSAPFTTTTNSSAFASDSPEEDSTAAAAAAAAAYLSLPRLWAMMRLAGRISRLFTPPQSRALTRVVEAFIRLF